MTMTDTDTTASMSTTEEISTRSPYEAWLDGYMGPHEALRTILSNNYAPIDATLRTAEQAKKDVRTQIEELARAIGEPVTTEGYTVEWRDGTLSYGYPTGVVDRSVAAIEEGLALALSSPLLAQPATDFPFEVLRAITPADALPPEQINVNLVPQKLLIHLLTTLRTILAAREERPRAGSVYITPEKPKRERRG